MAAQQGDALQSRHGSVLHDARAGQMRMHQCKRVMWMQVGEYGRLKEQLLAQEELQVCVQFPTQVCICP